MTILLDVNASHSPSPTTSHHDVAENWFTQRAEPFATCLVTQAALVRFLLGGGGPRTRPSMSYAHSARRTGTSFLAR